MHARVPAAAGDRLSVRRAAQGIGSGSGADPLRPSRSAAIVRLLPALALAAAAAALWWPALGWLVRTWRVHPYYAHGPLVVVAAVALLWRRRGELAAGRAAGAGLALVAGGAAVHVAAAARAAWPLSLGALLVALAGGALLAGGARALRAAAYPLAVAALAIPLPVVERLAPRLAAHAAAASAAVAGAFGVEVRRTGAMLEVGDGALTVGAPCSGMSSLVALVALSTILAAVVGGSAQRRAALIAAAVPLAMLANGIRLTSLLWLVDAFGTAFGLAYFHGPASPTAFLLATGGLLAMAHVLGCRVRPA